MSKCSKIVIVLLSLLEIFSISMLQIYAAETTSTGTRDSFEDTYYARSSGIDSDTLKGIRHLIVEREGNSVDFTDNDDNDDFWVVPNEILQTVTVNAKEAKFYFCSMASYINLKKITFSQECILNLYQGSFYGNTKLKEIMLPINTQDIRGAFLYCSNLNKLDFAGENEKYEVIDGCVVTKEEKPHLVFVPSNTTEFVVPDNIAVIDMYAFANCRKLKKVTLNEGLKTIETGAFAGCNLKALQIPKSVKEIGSAIVINNQNLCSISVAKGNKNFQSDGKALWSKKKKELLAAIVEKGVCQIPEGIKTTQSLFVANTDKVKKIIFPTTIKEWNDSNAYGTDKLSFKGKNPPKIYSGSSKHFYQLLDNGELRYDSDGNYIGKPGKNYSKRTILIHKKYKKNYTAWLRNEWGYKDYDKELKVKMY